jgi:hypothetical protein
VSRSGQKKGGKYRGKLGRLNEIRLSADQPLRAKILASVPDQPRWLQLGLWAGKWVPVDFSLAREFFQISAERGK